LKPEGARRHAWLGIGLNRGLSWMVITVSRRARNLKRGRAS
jgi:hypothetical protein